MSSIVIPHLWLIYKCRADELGSWYLLYPQTQRTCDCVYLHSSLPVCPNLRQKRCASLKYLIPFISFDLPDEMSFLLVSLSELFIMWALESD